METKNFLFSQKKLINVISLLLGMVLLSQCSLIDRKKIGEKKDSSEVISEAPVLTFPDLEGEQTDNDKAEEILVKDIVIERKTPPKLGFILSAGGMRTFSHIGVLKALEEKRIPITSIVGLGWGSLIASLYAVNGSVNSLEWQILKLREDDVFDNGILSSKTKMQSVSRLDGFLQKVFLSNQFEKLKTPMMCPTQSVVSGTVFWADNGLLSSNIKGCLAFPPFYKSIGGRVAAPYALAESIKLLKENGAEKVVFIDALGRSTIFSTNEENDFFRDKLLWQRVSSAYQSESSNVDEILMMDLENKSIRDFSSRKIFMQMGFDAGLELAEELINKYGY